MKVPVLIKDILFPKHCFHCYTYGSYLCDSCRKLCKETYFDICPYCEKPSCLGKTHEACGKGYFLDGHISLFIYKSVIKSVIKNVKYHFVREAISEIFNKTPKSLKRLEKVLGSNKNIALIPVPLHVQRKRRRGFNQSLEIAKIIAARIGLEINDSLVIRSKNTVSQTKFKTYKERNFNIKKAFSLRKREAIPKHAVIVDDVWTTGSTIKEIAYLLKKSGSSWIYGCTIAR